MRELTLYSLSSAIPHPVACVTPVPISNFNVSFPLNFTVVSVPFCCRRLMLFQNQNLSYALLLKYVERWFMVILRLFIIFVLNLCLFASNNKKLADGWLVNSITKARGARDFHRCSFLTILINLTNFLILITIPNFRETLLNIYNRS